MAIGVNAREVCGAVNPNLGPHSTCVCKIAHAHHRDSTGRQWANILPSEFEEIRADREDQLRQLLSWITTVAEDHSLWAAANFTVREIRDRLKAILDGE